MKLVWGWLRKPVLANLIEDVYLTRTLAICLGLYFVASWFGWHFFRCPAMEYLSTPCPGCGLTRSAKFFLRGDWQAAMQFHIFGPLALGVMGVLFIAAILPAQLRQRMSTGCRIIEGATGISQLAFVLLIVYWLVRVLFPSATSTPF